MPDDDDMAAALELAVNGEAAIAIKDDEVVLDDVVTRGRPKERSEEAEKKRSKGKGVAPSPHQ